MGKAMAYFLGIVAEMELDFNRERTRRSLELKRQRGIKGGRPRHATLSDPKKLAIIREMYDSKRYTVKQICDTFGLKDKSSLYRYLRQATA